MPQEEPSSSDQEQSSVEPNIPLLDAPFRATSNHFLKTLHSIGVSPSDEPAIKGATDKYVSATRNATIMSLAATPGIIANDPMSLMGYMVAIASVTGIAWYTISVEKVKKRYVPFGVELTQDMLEAFLSSCMLLFMISNTHMLGGRLSKHLPFEGFFESDLNWFIATFVTLLVTTRITWKTVSSTIKFDANDALLAGRTELEMQFYQEKLSELKNIANRLRNGQHLEAANHSIADGFAHYCIARDSLGPPLSEDAQEIIQSFQEKGESDQKSLDLEVISLFEKLLSEYSSLIKENKSLSLVYKFATKKLKMLKKQYNKKETVSQAHSDATFASCFEALARLSEQLGENLVT
jgi:hypothetical protein